MYQFRGHEHLLNIKDERMRSAILKGLREKRALHLQSFSKLLLRYKLRLSYYLLLPWVILDALGLLPTLLDLLLILTYLSLGLVANLVTARAPIIYVAKNYFMHNVPNGVSFAYGVVLTILLRKF